MKKYRQLQHQYDALQEEYAKVYAEKLKLAYDYNRLQEQQKAALSQDRQIRELYKNARRLKHDMKNHFMVLSSYLLSEDYEAARLYSSEILDKLGGMHSYVDTGNSLMNHIVNEKLCLAREHGIKIKAEIENLSFACMKSIDFSALLGNMLDNAIEASMNEKESGREIHLLISSKRGYEVICVKNRISSSVLKNNPGLHSAKPDFPAHGLGVPRMKEIAESYGGLLDLYETEEFFCVSTYIPKE